MSQEKNHKMKNDFKKEKRKALIASVCVFLFILALTVVALELPRRYYKKEDSKMVGQSSRYHYDQNEVHYSASLQQKINALSKSNITIVSTEKVAYTEEDLHVVTSELDRCFDQGWSGFLRYLLEDDRDARIVSYGATALWNDKDQVYSMDIRILVFYDEELLLSPAFIIYDEETGTIYGINVDTYAMPNIDFSFYEEVLGENRWQQILENMSSMNDVDYSVMYENGSLILSTYDYFMLAESQDANAIFGHYYTDYNGGIPGECNIANSYIYFFPGSVNGYLYNNGLVQQLQYTIYSGFQEVDYGYY